MDKKVLSEFNTYNSDDSLFSNILVLCDYDMSNLSPTLLN